MLGTVQFGMNYGIANSLGKPPYDTSRDIVKCAFEGGVNCLDTAAAYGDSEEVIGRILDDLNIRSEMTVVTKVRAVPEDIAAKDVRAWVEDSLANSLKRLRTDVLPAVLLHRDADYAKAYEYLEAARDKGQVLAIGVSGGTHPDITAQVVASGRVQALQIPTNYYDRRFRAANDGIIASAASRDIPVFARSAYLQGLAIMPVEEIEAKPHFAEFVPVRKKLDVIAKQAGLTNCEMAMRYVLSLHGITRLLVGVDSPQQMKENLQIAAEGPLSAELVAQIDAAVPELSPKVTNPVNWPQTQIFK